MSHPILITGAAGGRQGSTGRLVTGLLLKQGIPVRAFVHKLDARSGQLRQQGAERQVFRCRGSMKQLFCPA
jgi:hypothetical protein